MLGQTYKSFSPVKKCSIMQRHCLALDLRNDPALIAEYERWHQNVWPEILDSIRAAGISSLEIYRLGTRLFMILEADDAFSFEKKAALDAQNPRVQDWENLMWRFQKPLDEAREGEKWLPMRRIFEL